jgi:hypothetical protein
MATVSQKLFVNYDRKTAVDECKENESKPYGNEFTSFNFKHGNEKKQL